MKKKTIYTLDSKGELLITIMPSLAKEESRSISENVTWGKRKQFADGKVALPYKHFLGYRKGPDGLPQIVPEESEIILRIYSMFILGNTPCSIAKQLTEEGIPTHSGKSKWSPSTIESIHSNEKYKGDALLQKTYTVDFLTKKMIANDGKVPQYYVENSHPAIVHPWEFAIVQSEIKRRRSLPRRYSGQSVLATHIICGDCGDYYGSKTWHSTSKYRRTINDRRFSSMTDSQAIAELKYRLAKYIILSLRDKGVVTQEVAARSIRDLCQKYQPYTYELEVHSLWPNE